MKKEDRTVLVVDDQEDVLRAIRDILEEQNYSVCTAVNGKKGLEQAAQCSPDVVITDVIMPDMEGVEFIKALRRIHKDMPVIVMSGNPLGIQFFKAAGLFGARASLIKPFTRQKLLETVTAVLAS